MTPYGANNVDSWRGVIAKPRKYDTQGFAKSALSPAIKSRVLKYGAFSALNIFTRSLSNR